MSESQNANPFGCNAFEWPEDKRPIDALTATNHDDRLPKGRFAPSPTGRMHLGNIATALLSYLSAKLKNGQWLLRIEDLDPQRSKKEYAQQIEDDLQWLGLEWDEGGLEGKGPHGPYIQSQREHIYEHYLNKLSAAGLTFGCRCTKADLKATQAPHASDGNIIYPGTCRKLHLQPSPQQPLATRIKTADETIAFTDLMHGHHSMNMLRDCGDFVLRRADGAWAYQFAVVIDDALMGVTEILRGDDLLMSSPRQILLYRLLGFATPQFIHTPLVLNSQGIRLSKRDSSLSMQTLRTLYRPDELIGHLACYLGLTESYAPTTPSTLISMLKTKIEERKTQKQ